MNVKIPFPRPEAKGAYWILESINEIKCYFRRLIVFVSSTGRFFFSVGLPFWNEVERSRERREKKRTS